MHRLLLLTLALLVPGLCAAQSGGERTWFRVELIVFERRVPAGSTGEVWPEDPGLPDRTGAATLQPAASGGPGTPAPFQRVSSQEYELGPHRWSLDRGGSGTEPLLHLAWVQPVRGARSAVPLYLSDSDSGYGYAPRLEGTVRVRRSRFLHADVDLLLRRRDRQTGAPRAYRMQASRRMRSGELHYIDHPLMGVLIKVTPVKLTAGADGAGAPG